MQLFFSAHFRQHKTYTCTPPRSIRTFPALTVRTGAKMFPNGLVILTQPVSALRAQIPRLLDHVASVISDTVYIHLQPAIRSPASLHTSLLSPLACTSDVQSFITDVYGLSSSRCRNLDIRILLAHVTSKPQAVSPRYQLSKPLSVLVSDAPYMVETWNSDRASVVRLLQQTFSEGCEDVQFCAESVGWGLGGVGR